MMNRMRNEKYILSAFYMITLMLYLLVEYVTEGRIKDALFVLLLSFATAFLNIRQERLYRNVFVNEKGVRFYEALYGIKAPEMKGMHANRIFCNRKNDLFALLFACTFGIVIWSFRIWTVRQVQVVFIIYLFSANLATGLAIIRLFYFFYISSLWVSAIPMETMNGDMDSIRFIKQMNREVVFTAVVYCTTSLSSVIFMNFDMNIVIGLYTVFTILLIILTLNYSGQLISNKRRALYQQYSDKVNVRIGYIYREFWNSDMKQIDMEQLIQLLEVKKILEQEYHTTFNYRGIMSAIGMVVIAIIPILIQFFLEHL